MKLKLLLISCVLCFQFGLSQEMYLHIGKISQPMIIKIHLAIPIAMLKVAQETLTN